MDYFPALVMLWVMCTGFCVFGNILYHSYIDPLIGISFPENVTVIEEECGLQHHINVSWEVSRYYKLLLYHVYNMLVDNNNNTQSAAIAHMPSTTHPFS